MNVVIKYRFHIANTEVGFPSPGRQGILRRSSSIPPPQPRDISWIQMIWASCLVTVGTFGSLVNITYLLDLLGAKSGGPQNQVGIVQIWIHWNGFFQTFCRSFVKGVSMICNEAIKGSSWNNLDNLEMHPVYFPQCGSFPTKPLT